VDRVRLYPSGIWLDLDARPVVLDVPEEALVAPALVRSLAVEASRSIRSPVSVLAYTMKGLTTPEAIGGAAGALRLARLSPTR
jgi:hypothetical protein